MLAIKNDNTVNKINKIMEMSNIFRFKKENINGTIDIFLPQTSSTFKDTVKIIYDIEQEKNVTQDVINEIKIEENKKSADLIMEHFWKPYIEKYIGIEYYNFDDVRIDSAPRLPFFVRKNIYDYIKELKDKSNIFEENLFNKDPFTLLDTMKNAGVNTMTGTLYFEKYDPVSGFNKNVNNIGIKRGNCSTNGSINFTGTHDEIPLALAVLREIAEEENKLSITKEMNFGRDNEDYVKSLKDKIYQIIKEINLGNKEYVDLFKNKILKKIAPLIFGSSAGYYLLGGDENFNIIPCSVFENAYKEEKEEKLHIDLIYDMKQQISQFNRMLKSINEINNNKPSREMWFEHFIMPEKDITVIVRKEGLGFDVDTNIILVSNNPNKFVSFNKDDLHKIACWFQERTKPKLEDYDKAYWSITGNKEKFNKQTHIIIDRNIILSNDISKEMRFQSLGQRKRSNNV
jgi:hypothetical protein